MKIILGSASKGRQAVLKNAGYRFEIMHADIDEKKIHHPDPEKLALAVANAKADALVKKISGPAILITADQVVACNNKIYEKPISAEMAREYMRSYAENPAVTITAIVVVNTKTGKRAEGTDSATVYFNPIPEYVIDQLIEQGEIFYCAGGFKIEDEQGNLNPYIKRVEGDVNSVTGLPLKLLEQLLDIVR